MMLNFGDYIGGAAGPPVLLCSMAGLLMLPILPMFVMGVLA